MEATEQVAEQAGADQYATASASDVLNADDREYVYEPVPEWTPKGRPVLRLKLRSWSAADLTTFNEGNQDKASRNSMVRALVMSAVNEKDELIFSPKDIDALRKKSLRVLNRLQQRIMKLNFGTDELPAVAQAKNA